MYIEFNNNPNGRRVGDCAVRAISVAFDIPWDRAFDILAEDAKIMGDMPSSDSVWGAVLRRMGFVRSTIPDDCPDCYTVADFAEDHPRGVYVLGIGGHVVTVVDGDIYDSWDSSNEIPIYVWHRDRERRSRHAV